MLTMLTTQTPTVKRTIQIQNITRIRIERNIIQSRTTTQLQTLLTRTDSMNDYLVGPDTGCCFLLEGRLTYSRESVTHIIGYVSDSKAL
jgi:hypothetical protein